MSKFLIEEKPKQSNFKATSPYFSDNAKVDGGYKTKAYPFCLPRDYAEENLPSEIRQRVLKYFEEFKIKWHDGQNGKPSNHLCDSQVCCVNFLFPFANKPQQLAALLRPIYPDIQEMLPVENDQFVAFEWIGLKNYLGERMRSPTSERTRGANFTSADALISFRRTDGLKHTVLIEWKYTESYSSVSLEKAPSGTDRTEIYRPLFENRDCPIVKSQLPNYIDLFYEPFYQFMRQQFLANEMEKAREDGADVVGVLHIAPAHNIDFKRIISPDLSSMGDSATDVWSKLVKADRFLSVSTEDLFGKFDATPFSDLQKWSTYISQRYSWVKL